PLSAFNGTNPNGVWNLWVVDDLAGNSLTIAGWCLKVVSVCASDAECDDGNVCTTDTCGAGGRCTNTNNTAPCSDGFACTGPDQCAGGVCVPGPSSCNDNDACTVDSCNAQGDCAHAPVDCNDNNVCTSDSCSPATGCAHA